MNLQAILTNKYKNNEIFPDINFNIINFLIYRCNPYILSMMCEYCYNTIDVIDSPPAKSLANSTFCIQCAKFILSKKVPGWSSKIQDSPQIDLEKCSILSSHCKIHLQPYLICLSHFRICCLYCENHQNCNLQQVDHSTFESQMDSFIHQTIQNWSDPECPSQHIENVEEIFDIVLSEYVEHLNSLNRAKKSQSLEFKSRVLENLEFLTVQDLIKEKNQREYFESILKNSTCDSDLADLYEEMNIQNLNFLFIFTQKQEFEGKVLSKKLKIKQDFQDSLKISALGISMNLDSDFTIINKLEIRCVQYRFTDDFILIPNKSRKFVQSYQLKNPLTLLKSQDCLITIELDSQKLYLFSNPAYSQLSILDTTNPNEENFPILYLIFS